MSRTVLPPVFGPETSSVRSSRSMVRSKGTTSLPCASRSGWRPFTIANPSRDGDERRARHPEELLCANRAKPRATVQRVELDERIQCVEHRDPLRTDLVSQLPKNAIDFVGFLDFQLADAIPELDRPRAARQRGSRRWPDASCTMPPTLSRASRRTGIT